MQGISVVCSLKGESAVPQSPICWLMDHHGFGSLAIHKPLLEGKGFLKNSSLPLHFAQVRITRLASTSASAQLLKLCMHSAPIPKPHKASALVAAQWPPVA
ncbi:Hypothetical predicted protein [Podarcis lilfordi]|uniref:Uncharacterized protein n=1 Tax=Podarcis lilfordi TaxID=74358 RepID=A0AA35KD92_9SAUR|nr:Hypothetical predicted protein [Podarcis lilfordi]